MATVLAVCTAKNKGTRKIDVGKCFIIDDWGLENDAHGGSWHRQVSLLSFEKIEAVRARGAKVDFGDFGENLVVSGIEFKELPIGTKLTCGSVVLELTQIGKECHTRCEISREMGECIMPVEGVFTKVIKGGWVQVGDSMEVEYVRGCDCHVV